MLEASWDLSPEEVYEAEVDPLTEYLRILEVRARDARELYDANRGNEGIMLAWVRADATFKRERLAILGEECPRCEGTGELVFSDTTASYYTPSEPLMGPCSLCRRAGYVLPEVRQAYIDAEEAA